MNKRIFTIGYEGVAVEDVTDTLRIAGVTLLIDVRAVPISRKKGFSKTALCEALRQADISYVHLRELGNPKPGREAAKIGRYDQFERIFRDHLVTEPAQASLAEAIRLTSENSACLLCFERDPATCHRSIIAQAMVATNELTVEHLRPTQSRAGTNVAGSKISSLALR